jgi:hypothetical protein
MVIRSGGMGSSSAEFENGESRPKNNSSARSYNYLIIKLGE